jgi:hypothetical protein
MEAIATSKVSSATGSDGKTISTWAFSGHASHCHVLTGMLELRTDVQNRTASSVVQKRTAENLEITKNVVQCTFRKNAVRRLGSLLIQAVGPGKIAAARDLKR